MESGAEEAQDLRQSGGDGKEKIVESSEDDSIRHGKSSGKAKVEKMGDYTSDDAVNNAHERISNCAYNFHRQYPLYQL